MSITSRRRALVVAGLSGILLTGATLATSTAAHADDGSTAPSNDSNPAVTITDAVNAAEAEYPDCDVTAALLYDSSPNPEWDVEMTCDSGTIKYVTVDADSGDVADDADRTDDTGGSPSDDDDSSGSSGDDGDAPGTGANADYT